MKVRGCRRCLTVLDKDVARMVHCDAANDEVQHTLEGQARFAPSRDIDPAACFVSVGSD